jgi:hypothetical protein
MLYVEAARDVKMTIKTQYTSTAHGAVWTEPSAQAGSTDTLHKDDA